MMLHAVTATVGLLAWWLDHGRFDAPAMGAIVNRLVMIPLRAD
jgi:hypothetical protein